jgi:hypothetical protein
MAKKKAKKPKRSSPDLIKTMVRWRRYLDELKKRVDVIDDCVGVATNGIADIAADLTRYKDALVQHQDALQIVAELADIDAVTFAVLAKKTDDVNSRLTALESKLATLFPATFKVQQNDSFPEIPHTATAAAACSESEQETPDPDDDWIGVGITV